MSLEEALLAIRTYLSGADAVATYWGLIDGVTGAGSGFVRQSVQFAVDCMIEDGGLRYTSARSPWLYVPAPASEVAQ